MHNPEAVDVLDPADDLLKHFAGLVLAHFLSLHDVIEELSLLHVLHHQEEMLRGFDDLVQLDNVGVTDEFQDMDFPRHSLHVRHVHYLLLL